MKRGAPSILLACACNVASACSAPDDLIALPVPGSVVTDLPAAVPSLQPPAGPSEVPGLPPVEPFPSEPTPTEPDGNEPGAVLACQIACGAAECPCLAPPRVVIDSGGLPFAIDSTEVSVEAYARFVQALPPRPSPIEGDVCAFNESYLPAESSFDVDPNCLMFFDFQQTLAETPQLPVVCVDVCDARDYCAWMHGHLCGSSTGGNLTPELRASGSDEWFRACSAGGAQPYCYGNQFDPGACNTRAPTNRPEIMEVGTRPSCEGPVSGLFDMNGNIKEWIASCTVTEPYDSSSCYRVGGAFFEAEAGQSRCDSGSVAQRSTLGNDTGIRCCYDL